MSYRVFARKYRPSVFEEVVGQEHVTRTLQNAITQNRIAQAYLLVGPRGIGKTSTARILAKALNCANGPTSTPCNQCDPCREIAEGNCLDVLEIDGASNNSVEHVRELRENAAYSPARGPFKIYLIDEVHMLSTAAFNALLKTLEEPPAHVKFIFATTEAQKLPPTITSRCQRFDLRRIPAARMAEHLLAIAQKESIELDADAAQAIARGADGGLRDAESMLDQVVAFCGDHITLKDVLDIFGFTSDETVAALRAAIFGGDTRAALALIAEQAGAGKDLSRLLGDFIMHLRDILVAVSSGTAEENLPPTDRVLELLDHFVGVESRMRWAPDQKLHFDVAAIKAIHLLRQVTLDDVLDTLTAMRQGAPAPQAKATPAVANPAPEPPASTAAPARRIAPEEAAPPQPVPIEKPAPQPPAETPSMSVGEGDIWERAREKIIARAPLKSRWLKAARLVSQKDAEFVIEFPPSARDDFQFIWQRLQADFEAELTSLLNRRARITASIGDFEEPAPPEPEAPEPESAPAAEKKPPEPPPEPAPDPEAEFKNDPLIRKALELFKSEINAS